MARFLEENQPFIKRIFAPSLSDPELRLRLANKNHSCELRGLLPKDLPLAASDCSNISGTGKLLCSDARELKLAWKMTSCHSGFGRSLDGTAPGFVFGFSGNQSNAQDQLDLARDALFAPVAELSSSATPPQQIYGLDSPPLPSPWPDNPIPALYPAQ